MIYPVCWGDVPGGVRVILSSGRVARVLDRIPGLPGFVMLRNASGHTRAITVDPNAVVPVIVAEEEMAALALKRAFGHAEFLREVNP